MKCEIEQNKALIMNTELNEIFIMDVSIDKKNVYWCGQGLNLLKAGNTLSYTMTHVLTCLTSFKPKKEKLLLYIWSSIQIGKFEEFLKLCMLT